jgi:carboxyl-terminal processing protease
LRELERRKVSGVILDLRGNGGGILGDAVAITGDFIDTGPVVQVQNSNGKRQTLRDESPGTETAAPVVVLVDRFSASASEIVAAALQDYQRAIVVGTGPTHGKGTVQSLADLDRATGGKIELGVLKLTIQQFFRISGSSTQKKGVVPDILLPDPAGFVESGERTLPHAIEWSQVDRAEHEPATPTWKAADLAKNSALRVGKDPVFGKITAMIEVVRKRQADTRVPLAKPAWEARRKDQRAALDAVSPDLAKLAPRLTVKSIDDPSATVAPSPNGKTDDRLDRWRSALARDPWVEECVYILRDMAK